MGENSLPWWWSISISNWDKRSLHLNICSSNSVILRSIPEISTLSSLTYMCIIIIIIIIIVINSILLIMYPLSIVYIYI